MSRSRTCWHKYIRQSCAVVEGDCTSLLGLYDEPSCAGRVQLQSIHMAQPYSSRRRRYVFFR